MLLLVFFFSTKKCRGYHVFPPCSFFLVALVLFSADADRKLREASASPTSSPPCDSPFLFEGGMLCPADGRRRTQQLAALSSFCSHPPASLLTLLYDALNRSFGVLLPILLLSSPFPSLRDFRTLPGLRKAWRFNLRVSSFSEESVF